MKVASRVALIGSVVVLLAGVSQGVQAQPASGGGTGQGMMGPGMMMGPDMMRSWRGRRMCNPRTAGFAEWRTDRLEEIVKPTEAQRPKFDELKAASSKAAEIIRGACPTERPETVTGRMAAMEKRMEAMLQAIKTVRPAMDAFYETLTDEQKARLNNGRYHRRWHWHDRW